MTSYHGTGHSGAELLPESESQSNPLTAWIQDRTREFRDFDNSFTSGNIGQLTASNSSNIGQLTANNSCFQSPAVISSKQRQISRDYSPASLQMEDKELSPRARVTIDEDKLQVEFNVKEYTPEELSIKTEGDVLVVLGKQEVKDGGKTFVSKQFEQRFSLPSGARPENITSALSKDGVLTVTAGRDPPAIKCRPKQALENNDQVFQRSGAGISGGGGGGGDGLPHPRVKYDEDKFQISLDAQQYKPDELDVKVEGNNIIITAKQLVQEAGGTRTRVFEQKFSMPSGVVADKVSSSLSKDGVLVISAPRGSSSANSFTKSIENSMNKVNLTPSSWEDDRDRDSPFSSSLSSLPSRHGSIFDNRPSILDRPSIHDPRPSILDDGGFFDRKRSLFDNENSLLASNSETSGVSRVEYDANNYKIHVNVENFKPEELVVKTIENTIQVDAKHEDKTVDGQSYSTRSFSQSFTLPRGVNPDSITSALSKEGVLTISAPLPPALRTQNSERLVPIKHT